MIACLLVWVAAVGAAWLVGAAVLRLASAAGLPGSPPSRPVTILFGLCCLAVLGGVWSLFEPLRTGALAAGLALLALSATVLFLLPRLTLKEPVARRQWHETLLAGLAVAIVVAQTASPISVYDTGLYHIQAIRWIQGYAAVPGLANLHERLAFGAPWFEAQALFDPKLVGGRPVFALNGLVFVVAVSYFLGGLGSVPDRQDLSRLLRLGCVPAAFWLVRRGLSSPSPDVAVALLSWVVLLLLVEKFESGAGAELDVEAWMITALAIFAVMTKLSAAPLLLAPAWLIVRSLRRDRRAALAMGGLAAAVAAPFVIRSVIVTGYWWFPVPWTRLPELAWTVPGDNVSRLVAGVADWARRPNRPPVPALDLAAWVPIWADHLTGVDRMFLGSLPVLGMIHLARVLFRSPDRRSVSLPPGYSIVIGIASAGTLFWLISAPDPRFGWGFFPFLALLLAAPLLRPWVDRLPSAVLALVLAVILLDQGRRVIGQEGSGLGNHLLWPAPPPAIKTRTQSVDGLPIHLPEEGERCWDAPLPCAPALDSGLGARGATLDAGFLHR